MNWLIIKNIAFTILALLLGIFGLVLSFSDLGPSESWQERIIVAATFFFICGIVIGFCNPQLWLIAGLTSWGAVLMGSIIVVAAIRNYGSVDFSAENPPHISVGLVMLFMPIGLAVIGGYLGKLLRQMRKQEIVCR